MKRYSRVVLVGLAVVATGASPAAAADEFSSEPVSVPDANVAPAGLPQLLSVEVGHHATFDRVVFNFSSHVPGYNVSYVPAVTTDPSDQPVQLQGGAFIAVAMHSVASDQIGAPAAPQGRQTPLFAELREIAGAGDFEGTVSFGLGLTAQSGFRVFTLTNPDRLVVDVAIPSLVATGSNAHGLTITASALALAGTATVHIARRRRALAAPRA
ncbi:MAG TPA: hypothetical protein VHN36_05635 [Ilumatobacteraceae bacterium]|nr:hypothetical protein [Ilumatobacteraceae bacterium]